MTDATSEEESAVSATRREFVAGLAVGTLTSGAALSSDLTPKPSEIRRDELLLLFETIDKPFLTDWEAAQVLQADLRKARSKLNELYEDGVIEASAVEGVRLFWLPEAPDYGGDPKSIEELREEFHRLKATRLCDGSGGE